MKLMKREIFGNDNQRYDRPSKFSIPQVGKTVQEILSQTPKKPTRQAVYERAIPFTVCKVYLRKNSNNDPGKRAAIKHFLPIAYYTD